MKHIALPRFWQYYRQLPKEVHWGVLLAKELSPQSARRFMLDVGGYMPPAFQGNCSACCPSVERI